MRAIKTKPALLVDVDFFYDRTLDFSFVLWKSRVEKTFIN